MSIRSKFIGLLLLSSVSSIAADTLKHPHSLFVSTLSHKTTFHLGYAYECFQHSKLSLELLTGGGVSFIFFTPPDVSVFAKTRLNYNPHKNHTLFLEGGGQFVFNPWYLSDPDKYFEDCSKSYCPFTYLSPFLATGYTLRIKYRLDFSVLITINSLRFNEFWFSPGFEIKYRL